MGNPSISLSRASAVLSSRIDTLSLVSDEKGAVTRTFLSPAMRRANALVGGWMRQAGFDVHEDQVGNLIGRTASKGARRKTLLLGSHLDTVRDAGRFDGTLGVLLPISAMEILKARGVELPFDVELVGFSEEEGVRFSSAYIGSKGYAGRLRSSDLSLTDPDGVSVSGALKVLGKWKGLPKPAHRKADLLGYLEVHIEQGPILESKDLACGVVTAIAGQTRCSVAFVGEAGHAGATPMDLRRDALAGAAEFILAVEAYAKASMPLVATVGKINARPGASNVIAGCAEFTLDVRHPSDPRREAALRDIVQAGGAIARRRGLSFKLRVLQDNGAVACAPELTRRLEESVSAIQGRCIRLSSGAGHDAVVVSSMAPVSMLFVRCRRGLSHHPDEFVRKSDMSVALAVVVDFLTKLAQDFRK